MQKKHQLLKKRVLLGMFVGAILGVLLFYFYTFAPEELPQHTAWSFKNPMMWMMIVNTIVLGFAISLSGFVTTHPVFGFKMYPIIRGTLLGILFSFSMAIGSFLGQGGCEGFWSTIIFGAIAGFIIDFITTKHIGQGDDLD